MKKGNWNTPTPVSIPDDKGWKGVLPPKKPVTVRGGKAQTKGKLARGPMA